MNIFRGIIPDEINDIIHNFSINIPNPVLLYRNVVVQHSSEYYKEFYTISIKSFDHAKCLVMYFSIIDVVNFVEVMQLSIGGPIYLHPMEEQQLNDFSPLPKECSAVEMWQLLVTVRELLEEASNDVAELIDAVDYGIEIVNSWI